MRAARLLGALVALSLPAAAPARAAGPVNLAVSGGPAELSVAAGESAATSITVRNPAGYEQQVEVVITGVDVTGGAYDFSGPAPAGFEVAADPPRFTLGPGASRQVSLVVAAAAAAPVGSSSMGVIVRGVPDSAPGESPVVGEIGVPLFATVAGAVDDSGSITRFAAAGEVRDPGPVQWSLAFANSGNVHERISGKVDIFRGRDLVGSVTVAPNLVLRGTTKDLAVTWPGDGGRGQLTARARLEWGAGRSDEAEATLVIPAAPASADSGRDRSGGTARSAGVALPTPAMNPAVSWLAALLLLAVLLALLLLFLRRETQSERAATS